MRAARGGRRVGKILLLKISRWRGTCRLRFFKGKQVTPNWPCYVVCAWGRSYNVLYTSWGFNCSFGFVVNNDSGSGGAIEIPCLTNDQLLAHLGDVQETDKLPPHPSVKSMVQAQSTAGLWRRF